MPLIKVILPPRGFRFSGFVLRSLKVFEAANLTVFLFARLLSSSPGIFFQEVLSLSDVICFQALMGKVSISLQLKHTDETGIWHT